MAISGKAAVGALALAISVLGCGDGVAPGSALPLGEFEASISEGEYRTELSGSAELHANFGGYVVELFDATVTLANVPIQPSSSLLFFRRIGERPPTGTYDVTEFEATDPERFTTGLILFFPMGQLRLVPGSGDVQISESTAEGVAGEFRMDLKRSGTEFNDDIVARIRGRFNARFEE
ncbi:MAG: hypothetical protein ACREON_09310 [Gemmatimonadaceae bacterium]